MSTVYDPLDSRYLDDADLAEELDRVFDLCQGCRMCLSYCDAFPRLFDAVDRHDGDARQLDATERAQVIDACFQCKLCAVRCPYVPPHEWALDFPRLMARAQATARRHEPRVSRRRLEDAALASMDQTGPIGSALAPIVNRALEPGSRLRRLGERSVGIAAGRRLPSYARERFSRWFARHRATAPAEGRDGVVLMATCFVEYMAPRIGVASVRVLESHGCRVDVPQRQLCCGAPWLHQGNLSRFRAQAARVVDELVGWLDRGATAVVVTQPTCGYVMRHDYAAYLGSEEARRVSAAVRDVSEFVVERARSGVPLPSPAREPGTVTYHVACPTQAQGAGLRGRDLLRLLGASVRVVDRCAGIDGTWGWRVEHQATSVRYAKRVADAVLGAASDVVVGDCHLANTVIDEQLGIAVGHPIELAAALLGLEGEEDVQ